MSKECKVDFLEEFKFEFRKKFSQHQCDEVNLVSRKNVYNDILTKIEYGIYGTDKELAYEIDYHYPATWWQHLKESKFPKFLLKMFPVKQKTEKRVLRIDHTILFPEVTKKFAKKNGFVKSKVVSDEFYKIETIK